MASRCVRVCSVSLVAAGSAVQTQSAIWGIRFLIGITPIIAALITTFCMWRYPLGRDAILKKAPVTAGVDL